MVPRVRQDAGLVSSSVASNDEEDTVSEYTSVPPQVDLPELERDVLAS